MSIEHWKEELGIVHVSARHLRNNPTDGGIDIVVMPLDAKWLLSKERTCAETNRLVEGWLSAVEVSLLDTEHKTSLQEAYGVDPNTLTRPQARFLAYTELLAQNQRVVEIHTTAISNLESQYQADKLAISKKKISKGKRAKETSKLHAANYAPRLAQSTLVISEQLGIRDLILRKATFDIFSTSQAVAIPIGRLSKATDEIYQSFDVNGMLANSENANLFLVELSKYLRTCNDRRLFQSYSYSYSFGIVRSISDTDIIQSALTLGLNSGNSSKDKLLAELGKSFFVFLAKRASSQSISELQSSFPRLALIFDVLTSIYSSDNLTILEKAIPVIVDPVLKNCVTGTEFQKESARFVSSVSRSCRPLLEWARLNGDYEVDSWRDVMRFAEPSELPKVILHFLPQDVPRLFSGLEMLLKFYKKRPIEQRDRPASKVLLQAAERVEADLKVRMRHEYVGHYSQSAITFATNIYPNIMLEMIFAHLGIHRDLSMALLLQLQKVATEDVYSQKADPSWTKQTTWEQLASKIGDETTRRNYLIGFLENSSLIALSELKMLESQNEYLLSEIMDNSRWFVSPRGDRFSAERDQILADNHINSIAYNIDRNRPREFRIYLQIGENVKPIEFWLNTDGKLLNLDRSPLMLTPNASIWLKNIFFQRLYVITSGKLATEPGEITGEGDSGFTFSWRRAHYRIYPVGSIYNLESNVAQNHAEWIEEDYGIKIWDEIFRRRKIGTLAETQVMTFVREVSPRDFTGEIVTTPNELPFEPEWVPVTL